MTPDCLRLSLRHRRRFVLNPDAEYISGGSDADGDRGSRIFKASEIAGKIALEHGYDIIHELYGPKDSDGAQDTAGESTSRDRQVCLPPPLSCFAVLARSVRVIVPLSMSVFGCPYLFFVID